MPDDVIINYHPEDLPDSVTALKREILNNPDRPIFIPTLLGERYIDVPAHRVLDFIKHDPLIVGFVEHSDELGRDVLLLRPYSEVDYA